MKRIKNQLLLLTILFSSFMVFAQKGYETGYIVTNQKDTLYGYVKDRKLAPFGKLYKKIIFKKEGKRRKYGPDKILAYQQGSNKFESKWIRDADYPFQATYLSQQNYGNKTFLKVIVKGYLSYYYWEFMDPESDYVDAVGFYKREDENKFIRVSQGIFGLKKKSLAKYFKDCPELVSKITSGEYNDPIEIVKFYNLLKENNN